MEPPPAPPEGRQPAQPGLVLCVKVRPAPVREEVGDAGPLADGQPLAQFLGFPRAQGLLHVGPAQEVEGPLLSAAVGVLAAGEAAAGQAQLPDGVVQRPAGRLPIAGPARLGVGLQIGIGQ